ncbi:hypothetical protein [Desulfospira joergensenii]|uniref:hypothetical protein n=1 Tax=Desulfospira joergensenii TaxID=53329 RepID=UPI0003B69776|nr:hypothetical protein [Desulfospira joergensenii]
MIRRIAFVFVAVVLWSANGNTGNNLVFSSSSDTRDALKFIGAPVSGNPIQGSIITSGEYYDFSQELLDIWVKKDSARLKSLLTQSTVDLYTADGEANILEQWATGMTEHLLKCKRENPKIFITLIDDLPNNQMYISQKQWFTYPETPPVALLLYSYDAEKQQLLGRMLYPLKKNGKIHLLLEKPKT